MRSNLAQAIASMRGYNTLSQKDLAAKMQVQGNRVSLWESGKVIPELHNVTLIEEILRCPGRIVPHWIDAQIDFYQEKIDALREERKRFV